MRRLPSPNPTTFPSTRPAPTNWAAIYQSFSNMLIVPPTMRSSKSQLSLKDLPNTVESLHIDRTANSTPAAKGKKGAYLDQSAALTPPIDKPAKWTRSTNVQKECSSNDSSGDIILESRAEDDVFSGDLQPRTKTIREPLIAGKAVSEYASNSNATCPPYRVSKPQTHAAGAEVSETSVNNVIAPRPDRLLEPITPSNAQGVLPPDAAIFVANLSVHRTDEQLEISCREAFEEFGQCIVKVRRDKHKHPFALIQYHTTQDANRAIEEGQQLLIDGRRVRVELAECRRSVILSRIGGGAITSEEARELLGKYGSIAQTQPTTHADGRLHGIPEGMWVKFAYYLDFKDCLKAFNNTTNLFKVTEAPNVEPRTRPAISGGSPGMLEGLQTPRSSVDQKSIYVGNLPEGTTEAELVELFAEYGEIKGCNVIRKPITGGIGYNIFGFIEFANEAQALPASHAEIDIQGQRIRVEPKEYSSRRNRRCQEFEQVQSIERNRHGISWGPPRAPAAWGRSGSTYRSPKAPMSYAPYAPYGAQPFYMGMMSTPQGLIPFHPGYLPGHSWTKTPPSSAPRQYVPHHEEFYMDAPPPQFIPMTSPALSMATFHSSGHNKPHKFPRQYQQTPQFQ